MNPDSRRSIALPATLLGLLLLAIVLAGARRENRAAGDNDTPAQSAIATVGGGRRACQPSEQVPTDARRLRLAATVQGTARVRVITGEPGGAAQFGPWATIRPGETVVPLPETVRSSAELCFDNAGPGSLVLLGTQTGPEDRLKIVGGEAFGRVRIEYLLGHGRAAFWTTSLLPLAKRIHAANGSAFAPWLALAGLFAAFGAAAALVVLATSQHRREIAAVAVMALGSGALWAGLMPMLESTDELAHAAYTQSVAELGHPPRQLHDTGEVSQELACWATVTRLQTVRFFLTERPPWQPPSGDPCAGMSRKADAAQYQAVQPPAYYAMAAAGYKAVEAAGGSLADRLLVSRLVSVALTAASTLAIFFLVRELIPSSPWSARIAAIVTALQPVAAFNLSMVNSDALVVAVSSWIALVLARAWRRHPTRGNAWQLGALYLLGLLAKLNFLVVLPVAIGLQVLIYARDRKADLREQLRRVSTSVLVAAGGFATYAVINSVLWDRAIRFQEANQPGAGVGPRQMVSYLWQTFLPPLGFMRPIWHGRPPVIDGTFVGWTSRLGWWNDYGIGGHWPTILAVFASMLVLAGVTAAFRVPGRRRAVSVAIAAMGAYLVLMLASISAPSIATASRLQPRYVLPLMALWGLAAGAAVTWIPAGWRRAATGVLGVGMVGWTVLAIATTLSRFYL